MKNLPNNWKINIINYDLRLTREQIKDNRKRLSDLERHVIELTEIKNNLK